MGNQQPVPQTVPQRARKNRNLKPRQKWARRLAREMELNERVKERVKPSAEDVLLLVMGTIAVYRTMFEADMTRDMDPVRKQKYHDGMNEIRYEIAETVKDILHEMQDSY